MNKPTIDELMRRVPNKYILAVLAAKRARLLTNRDAGSNEDSVRHPVSVALEEIAQGRLTYQEIRQSLK